MSAVGALPPVLAVFDANITAFEAKAARVTGILAGEGAGSFGAAAKKAATAMVGVGLGLAALGAGAVDMAMKFDAQMERVVTQAGAAQAEIDGMKTKILALAGPTAQAPEALALALYHVESAGFRGATALSMVQDAAKGATIGNANLEDVTQAMIGTMASGLPDIKGSADAMAFLNEIVGTGDMKMQQLAEAIGVNVLPTFKIAGLTMKDFGASLATLTDNATPANEVATRLRMTVSMMAAPTHAATKALASIGITQYQLADDMRGPNGLLTAATDLKTHLDALGTDNAGRDKAMNALTRAFGGGRSAGSIETLIDEYSRLQSKYQVLGDATQRANTYQDAWGKTQETMAYKVHALRAAFDAFMVTIGEKLMPVAMKLLGWGQQAMTWMTQHKGVTDMLTNAIKGGLVVALVAAAVAVGDFLGPIGLAAVAVAAFIPKIIDWYQHSQTAQRVVADVTNAVKVMAEWLKVHVPEAISTTKRIWEDDFMPPVRKGVEFFEQKAGPALEKLRDWFDKNRDSIHDLGTKVADVLTWFEKLYMWIAGNELGLAFKALGLFIQVAVDQFLFLTRTIQDTVGAIEKVIETLGHLGSINKDSILPAGTPGAAPAPIYSGPGRFGSAGPGRASGGPVAAGSAYTVGEKGPETLVMGSQGGGVIPNGGGGSVTINIHGTFVGANSASAREAAAALGPAIRDVLLRQQRIGQTLAISRGGSAITGTA